MGVEVIGYAPAELLLAISAECQDIELVKLDFVVTNGGSTRTILIQMIEVGVEKFGAMRAHVGYRPPSLSVRFPLLRRGFLKYRLIVFVSLSVTQKPNQRTRYRQLSLSAAFTIGESSSSPPPRPTPPASSSNASSHH